MFKKSYNRAVLQLSVDTRAPLLIRSGATPLDPSAADLTPVRTRHGRHGTTVYVPGTSLKGVLRAAAEASLRSHDESFACDPLRHNCSGRISHRSETWEVHKLHCRACRVFGSTRMKGRASVRDLFPWRSQDAVLPSDEKANLVSANATELRHNVAIDRKTSAVAYGPFDQELVPAGVQFWGELGLENYQAWQLGLISTAIQELNDGMAQLGSSKSRGLGMVAITIDRIVHEQPSGRGEVPLGVGRLASEAEVRDYGLLCESDLPACESIQRGLADRFVVEGEEGVQAWMEAGSRSLEAML